MIKQTVSILLLSIGMMANAQNKEVKIIKKTTHPFVTKIDTNVNVNIDTNTNTNVNLSIVIDGDKITINGKPADKNDPRLKLMGKPHLNRITKGKGKGKDIIVEDITFEKDPNEMEEGSDDTMDMMLQQAPTPNAAFLGVITEATEKGAKINTVSEGSPADKAGLKQDDIITKLNDQIIDGPKALYEAVGKYKPTDKVEIHFIRNEKEQTISAVLEKNKANDVKGNFYFKSPNGQMPNLRGFKMSPDQNFSFEMPDMEGLMNRMDRKPKIGISIEDLEVGEGVKIKEINEGSPAEKAGLKKNDIILSINGKKVKDVDAIKPEIKSALEGTTLHLQVKREKDTKNIDLIIPKKIKSADL